jgi:hypothetical protein
MQTSSIAYSIALSLTLFVTGGVSSQERVPVTAPTKTTKLEVSVQNDAEMGLEAKQITHAPFTDKMDVLDYAPMEDVFKVLMTGEVEVTGQRLMFNPYTLSFPAKNFAPERGVDMRMLLDQAQDPRAHRYGYIMIRDAISDPRKIRQLTELGVELLGPHTYQSYAAKIPLSQLNVIGSLPYVHWVGYALPEQKVCPRLAAQMQRGTKTERYRVDVSVFSTDINPRSKWIVTSPERVVSPRAVHAEGQALIPNGPFHQDLVAAGLEFENYTDVGNVHIFRGFATRDEIAKIQALHFVAFMEPVVKAILYHDQTMAMINQDRVRDAYDGGTITVGIIDSGLQNNPSTTRHRDFGPKYLYALSNIGNSFNDPCAHGTHVAGTTVGEGIANNDYRGAAPGIGHTKLSSLRLGKLFGQVGSDPCASSGSVSTLYDFMKKNSATYGDRPRVINNSWGADKSSGWSGADSRSRVVDGYVFTYDQLHVFAAGNSGKWTGAPGAAKNVLTVGGVLDAWTSTISPGDPYTSSGCGTSDGRRKPEVTAPGSSVCSTSTASRTAYSNKSGTSMAAPHVTGALASLIDHHSFYDYRVPNLKSTAMASAEYQGSPGSSSGWFKCSGKATGDGSGAGYGMINASSMHGSSTHGYKTGWHSGVLKSTAQGLNWDVAVPSNAEHVKIVGTWTETAASAGATKARRADMRMWLDVPPFTSGNNTGEFALSSSAGTVLSMASYASVSTGLCATSKGKTIRVKAYGQSIPAATECKFGFTMIWHVRGPKSPTPTLTVTSSSAYVKPGGSVTVTGTVAAGSGGDEVENARVYPSSLSGFLTTRLHRTSADNILHQYTGSSHPSNPFPSLTGGMTIGQGLSRDLNFDMTAPSSAGNKVVTLGATADPGNKVLTDSTTICVDGTAPNKPSGLKSTSHTVSVWSKNDDIRFSWTPGADTGCAGLVSQYYGTAQSSCPLPGTTISATATSKTLLNRAQTTSSTGHYFAVRGADKAGNIGSSACVGPYLIDTGKPSVTLVRINGGSYYTKSLSVTVAATGSDSRSGVSEMRHSNNGSTWSPWVSYKTSAVSWSLSSYGGNTAQGTKTVYCQVKDKAGNISSSGSDTIIYDSQAPVVTSCRLNGGATYTSSLTATLTIGSTGSPTLMRWGCNGTNWSPYNTFAASSSVDLSQYGGNSSPGFKRVYVQLRDAAGNTSNTGQDVITFVTTPSITGGTRTTLSNVTKGYYRLTGSGFYGASRVDFGSSVITNLWTSQNDDWWNKGALRVLSDSVIYVYPPQGLPATQHGVRVRNPLLSGNVFNVFTTFETNRVLLCNSKPTAGKTVTINIARSNSEPNSTPCIICFSPLGTSSLAPGIVSLKIGGNFSALYQFSILSFDSATRRLKVTAPTSPSHTGLTLWFQAVYLRDPLPVPTTNASKCVIQ